MVDPESSNLSGDASMGDVVDYKKGKQMPALYNHCVTVYEEMERTAHPHPQNAAVLQWEGFSTKLIKSLHFPVPYYTLIFKRLQAMDCIRQERRGGSTSPSLWVLLGPPSPQLFEGTTRPARMNREIDAVRQQNRDLNQRLMKVERRLKAVIEELESWAIRDEESAADRVLQASPQGEEAVA